MSNLDLSLYRSIEALADNDIPNPILRIDFFLHAVITGEECNIEPVTKTEEYLYALATGDESRLRLYGDSISLLEEYLEALRTGDIDNLREPRTREEIILYQAITGEDLGVEPISRIETYLSMLQNAGGLDYILSTSTSASVIPLTNSINGRARVQEMCGDTLVNCIKTKIPELHLIGNGTPQGFSYDVIAKGGTTYTIFANVTKNTNNSNFGLVAWHVTDNNAQVLIPNGFVGQFKGVFRTTENVKQTWNTDFWAENTSGELIVSDIFMLEGDWTNREIPSEYFEGMKSCGQDDENGHKIEILSQNKNLFNDKLTNLDITNGANKYSSDHASGAEFIRIKPNTPYTLSSPIPLYNSLAGLIIVYYDINKKFIKHINMTENKISPSNARYCRVRTRKNPQSPISTEELSSILLQLEEGTVATSYAQSSMNKKEIQLPQPLRGLPNGVQDRIVYLDENTTPIAPEGKGLYLEKNVGEVTFNGKERYNLSSQSSSTNLVYWTPSMDGRNSPTVVISDKLASLDSFSSCSNTSGIFLNNGDGGIGNFVISLPKSQCPNLESFTDWLSTNKPICYYPLIKATYTKISDVNFECYENATVYVDSGAVAPTKTVIRYPYKQPALFSL